MKRYTLVQDADGYEALYSEGRLIIQSDDVRLTAFGVLEAIAQDTIAVTAEYVEVAPEYSATTLAMEGWPERLDEIPEEARR